MNKTFRSEPVSEHAIDKHDWCRLFGQLRLTGAAESVEGLSGSVS